jgi:hypothetical protein
MGFLHNACRPLLQAAIKHWVVPEIGLNLDRILDGILHACRAICDGSTWSLDGAELLPGIVCQLRHDIIFGEILGGIPNLEGCDLGVVSFGDLAVIDDGGEPLNSNVDEPGDGSHSTSFGEVLDSIGR